MTDRIQPPAALAMSYTDAARAVHEQHCTRCRTLTEDANARAAANGASMRRRDRIQLGLRLTANSDAEEALRRVQGRPAPTTKPRPAVAR